MTRSWILGRLGITYIKKADECTRHIGPEPALGVPKSLAWNKGSKWVMGKYTKDQTWKNPKNYFNRTGIPSANMRFWIIGGNTWTNKI